jgi:hypothetical protein
VLVSFASLACVMQELKHLRMVNKKDIVYPEGFPGGLKGLVKSVLEEYGKQFVGQPADDVAKSMLVVQFWCDCMCICLTFR